MPPLSKQQTALVDAKDNTFAEACPGAGKTRAIVVRFQRRVTEEPRKGIALVSITNGAIDEVRKRCGERADVLLAPHFVGTFDSFINRFITRPLYVQQYGQTPAPTLGSQAARRVLGFRSRPSGAAGGGFPVRHGRRGGAGAIEGTGHEVVGVPDPGGGGTLLRPGHCPPLSGSAEIDERTSAAD